MFSRYANRAEGSVTLWQWGVDPTELVNHFPNLRLNRPCSIGINRSYGTHYPSNPARLRL